MTVTVALSEALPDDVTVPLTLTAGTAEAGDYGSLASITDRRWSDDRASGAITTTDDADTDDETFTVALGSAAAVGHRGESLVDRDND